MRLYEILSLLTRKGVVSGEIKAIAGNAIPDGWLLCDGSEISKTTYPNLYEAIGDLWGTPSSSSNFKLPNLAGRVPVGINLSDTSFDVVGETGGEKTHTLTIAEMPSHNHHAGVYQVIDRFGAGVRNAAGAYAGFGDAIYTGAAGSSAAHNNLPPYAVVKYIICAI